MHHASWGYVLPTTNRLLSIKKLLSFAELLAGLQSASLLCMPTILQVATGAVRLDKGYMLPSDIDPSDTF